MVSMEYIVEQRRESIEKYTYMHALLFNLFACHVAELLGKTDPLSFLVFGFNMVVVVIASMQ